MTNSATSRIAYLTAALLMASSAHAGPFETRIPLKGVRTVAAPPATTDSAAVTLSAPALHFGDVQLGKPATLSLTVTNSGKSAAAVSDIGVTDGAALFTRTHNCGSSLAASSSCKVDVSFAPLEEGAAQGALQVAIGNLAQEVSLTGKGIAPMANASVWTPFTMPVAAYWRNISYGNGVFVSTDASTTGKSVYSADGVTWQAGTMPYSGSWTTTYGEGKFVAVGWGYGGPWSATSTNGRDWSAGGKPPTGMQADHVVYSNGVYVASVGAQNGTSIVARSTDGITWTAVTVPLKAQFMGATAGGGKFVLTAVGLQALMSTDGLNWSKVVMPANGMWGSVTYGNGRFVAVSQGSTNASAVSTDGITWTKGMLPAGFSAADVTYGNGKFVVGGNSRNAAQSVDGLNWTENTVPGSLQWTAVGFGNGTFVTLGNNSNQGAFSQ